MSINCGHTVCKHCAKSLVAGRRIKCPFDNKSFECVNADSLGRNFALLDILEAQKSKALGGADERLCSTHQQKKVKFYCK